MKLNHLKITFLVVLSLAFPSLSQADLFDHQADQHKGPFVQAGMLGSIDLDIGDNIRVFDFGPGAFVGLGYNFGILGVRSHFHYAQMDVKNNIPISSDLYGGSLELKIMPLGESDIFFQPYIVAGAGASFLELSVFNNAISTGDWGFTGNGGVGFDIYLTEGFALTLETNIRPSVFYNSNLGANSDYDVYFYDFMGGFTYVFGGKAKEKPAPVSAAPAPAPVVKSEPVKVYKTGEKIDLKGKVNFKTNSAEIDAASYPVLDDAVAKMKAHPEIALVEIEGHTDNVGKDEYNLALSQRRTESVKSYFTNRGIAASRLTTKGYGEAQPVASNDTTQGRADNRRIVFRVAQFKE